MQNLNNQIIWESVEITVSLTIPFVKRLGSLASKHCINVSAIIKFGVHYLQCKVCNYVCYKSFEAKYSTMWEFGYILTTTD